MARFARLTVLTSMIETGLVPVFHHGEAGTARDIVAALSKGGARVIEFTNRGDHAVEVFSEVEKYCSSEHPQVILGVGSVVDDVTAGMYINLGANFVVGPTLDRRVAAVCNRRKVAYSPGCATPTEISLAHELGCEIVKVFPGGLVGGPAFVKAVRAPCPWARLMPTGGVDITEESLSAWFEAGVACVGIGSKLVSRDLVEAADWDALERRTADVMSIISTVR
ncbi:MAG: bifunctional 4-hydroxy-2-oxoglutarate aldolase/2-dehydro-3-deoxy-phosphogluconate aldolase [Acidimicrobiia bacterium]|nr:bifunctional 4-hydroxy-2-oxoglutarate aldolase/2-dehydro-3-deoxy-phosphogluconate aldolase [Acidimicrobiia bacterium]